MKKLIVFALLMLPFLLGQTIVYVNSAVIAWDAVTKLADGTPVPVGEVVKYEVLRARPAAKASAVVVGETAALEYVISFPAEGDWVVGVRAVRTVGTERIVSDINWSDVSGIPSPFVLRYYRGPAVPENLRMK